MGTIQSGADTTKLTIDPVSLAARVILYDSTGRDLSLGNTVTYSATNSFTPVATPTDLVTISGSATKLVRVLSMSITVTNTAAGSQQFFLIKRATADTGGTFVTTISVPHDSFSPVATAVVGHYTGNPTINNTVGKINIIRVASPVLVGASFAGLRTNCANELIPFIKGLSKPIVLRGTAEQLVINFNGAALVSGQVHTYRVVWTEF